MRVKTDYKCEEYKGKKVFVLHKGEIKEGTFKGCEDISFYSSACYVGYIAEIPYQSFLYFYTTKESIEEELNEEYKRELVRALKEKDILEDKIKDLRIKIR